MMTDANRLLAFPGGLPRRIHCRGERFEFLRQFKHDFFAATGLYRGPNGLAVLKMGRQNEFMTIPADWRPPYRLRFYCGDDYANDDWQPKPDDWLGGEGFTGHLARTA